MFNPPPGYAQADAAQYAADLAGFLSRYTWIYQCKLVDFLAEDRWARLPDDWKEPLLGHSYSQLHHCQLEEDRLPASLRNFLVDARRLSMPKQPPPLATEAGEEAVARPLEAVHLCNGMCPKKRHEVERLAAVVSRVCHEHGASRVVDIGSGEGYLSTTLHFVYGLPVVAVEGNEGNNRAAEERTVSIARADAHQARKKLKRQRESEAAAKEDGEAFPSPTNEGPQPEGQGDPAAWRQRVVHVPCRLSEDFSAEQLLRVVGPAWEAEEGPATEGGPRLCLAGLHACGNLSVTMLRLWLRSPDISALVNVGCCYYGMAPSLSELPRRTFVLSSAPSLSDAKDEELCTGPFPLSAAVRQLNFNIGKGGLKLACEGLRTWLARSAEEFTYMVRHTFFRCVAQCVIRRLFPEDYLYLQIKGAVRKGACATLATFLQHAIAKLRHCRDDSRRYPCPPAEELQHIAAEFGPAAEHRAVAFLFLRAAIATALESYIVVDRYLFLRENCGPTDLIQVLPIFDEVKSPRNLCIVHRDLPVGCLLLPLPEVNKSSSNSAFILGEERKSPEIVS